MNKEPVISPTPRPTRASRQFFCFSESDQYKVFKLVDMVSVIRGTNTPAYIAQLIAVQIMKGTILSILDEIINLAVSNMSAVTEV